jgi:hypothetical protein
LNNPLRAGRRKTNRGGRDRAYQVFHVVTVQHKLLRKLVKQFGLRRRTGRVEMIDRTDQAAAKEIILQPIHRGLGEPRIGGAGDPFGQHRPLSHPRLVSRRGAVKELRLDDKFSSRG